MRTATKLDPQMVKDAVEMSLKESELELELDFWRLNTKEVLMK